MKKRFLKAIALALCGLLVFHGSVMPTMASERVPLETENEEAVDDTARRSQWISAITLSCPNDEDHYKEEDSGSGVVNFDVPGSEITTAMASMAIENVILTYVAPGAVFTAGAMAIVIGNFPNYVVTAFEKYAPSDDTMEYEYTRYKNETDSTMMYEYYYYVVEYYIDGVLVNDEPITFYETRTFI